jgi:leucyl aminopeptidase
VVILEVCVGGHGGGVGLRLLVAIVVGALGSSWSVAAVAPVPGDKGTWITIGADAFATVSAALPRDANGDSLARLAERDGVVLSYVRAGELDAISAEMHKVYHRCGGYVAHGSLAEAQAELARIETVSRATGGGVPFVIDQPAWVATAAGAVDPAQILGTMTSLSTNFANRYHVHPSGTNAAVWIRDLWAGYAVGRPEVTVELVNHPTATTVQPSVRLVIPGTSRASEVVVLGAHLDTTRSSSLCVGNPNCIAPGADDDASGIATLSEAIRVLLASGYQPQRTIHIFGYAAEEVGLRGSGDIAATYLAAGTNVVAVLQQDMTGFNGSAADIVLITDWTNADLNAFIGELIDTYQPSLVRTTTTCGYACSDHGSWHTRGYPAAFAFEALFGQHNAQIHQAADTVATLGNDATHAAKFARLAVAFAVETGTDPLQETFFADGFESATR